MRRYVVLGLAVAATTMTRAATAVSLSSFEAIEEPLVRYYPKTERFEPDGFINIVDVGGGTFRFHARYNSDAWDGDRDTLNKDRQRAEVKGLGPHQQHGETFDYATTWRSNAEWRGTAGFCHIFQLKAINGDSGAPLITLSIRGDKAAVEANPDGPKIIAREFPWRPDTWQRVRIRVKVSPRAEEGELLVSVDGDAWQGKTGVALARPGASAYRPKWGFYRRATVNASMGDDFIEHKGVTATNAAAGAVKEEDFVVATVATQKAEKDPAAAMAWAEAQTNGHVRRDAMLRIFSRWADRDLAGAARWLHARAPRPELDLLVWLFVTDTTYRYVKRDIALAAAPLIHDRELRAQAFEHVVEIWSRSERDAALAFLEKTHALTPTQKQAIAAKLRRRP